MPASECAALRDGLEAVMREAGALALATGRTDYKHWTKGHDRSPVSEADIAVNNLLQTQLIALVPDAGWLSEETEDNLAGRSMRLTWIVDPIDGTRAFITGKPDWTISVALVADGRPELAALFAPVSDEMFIAARGAGATLNSVEITASRSDTLDGARLAGPKRYLDLLTSLYPATLPQPKVHSLALRLARVAHNGLDVAFASAGSSDWDLAAADLLIHEAGGALTDFDGQQLRYNRSHVKHGALIAAGPTRHGALIDLVRARQAEFA